MKLRTASWRGPARWVLIALAEVWSRTSVQISAIAAHSFTDTAWGYGLTRKSASDFNNTRIGVTRTIGTMTVTDDGSVGPVVWPARSRIFSPQGEFSALKFTNTEEVTVTVDVVNLEFTVESQSGGASYNNVPSDSNWDISAALAGVTLGNPDNDEGPANNWITVLGANSESDTVLRARDVSKWATLGGNPPFEAYEFWARSATDGDGNAVGITRVLVPEPPGDGTLIVYIATSTGTADASQVAFVQAYIDPRRSKMATPTVTAAVTATITITGVVKIKAASLIVEANIVDEINEVINETDIGGTLEGTDGKLILSEIVTRVKLLDRKNIIDFNITNPASNPDIDDDEIAIGGSHVITVTVI